MQDASPIYLLSKLAQFACKRSDGEELRGLGFRNMSSGGLSCMNFLSLRISKAELVYSYKEEEVVGFTKLAVVFCYASYPFIFIFWQPNSW